MSSLIFVQNPLFLSRAARLVKTRAKYQVHYSKCNNSLEKRIKMYPSMRKYQKKRVTNIVPYLTENCEHEKYSLIEMQYIILLY
jgi:hypothetical protein